MNDKAHVVAAALFMAVAGSGCATSHAETAHEAPIAIRAEDPALQWGPCPPIFPAGCRIAVLHGHPARPNADIFLRVPGGAELSAHWHTSAERMILVAGRLEVQYQGASAITLTPGQYAFGPARLPHRAKCMSDELCTLFIAFEGPVDAHATSAPLD
jgi:quercetin dioxygenase-like cupin family protein